MDPGRLLVRQLGQTNQLPICEIICLRDTRCRAIEEDFSGISAHSQSHAGAHPCTFTAYTPHNQHTHSKLPIVRVERPLT